jgi:hypothetical protein
MFSIDQLCMFTILSNTYITEILLKVALNTITLTPIVNTGTYVLIDSCHLLTANISQGQKLTGAQSPMAMS